MPQPTVIDRLTGAFEEVWWQFRYKHKRDGAAWGEWRDYDAFLAKSDEYVGEKRRLIPESNPSRPQ